MSLLPTTRLALLLLYGAPLWGLAALAPGGALLGTAYVVLLIGLCVWDACHLPHASALRVTREVPPRLSLNAVQEITLHVHNTSASWLHLHVHDNLPDAVTLLTPLSPIIVGPQQTAHWRYHVQSVRRGLVTCGDVVLRCTLVPRWGLLQRQLHVPQHDDLKIYPQFLHVHDYALLARIDQRHDVSRRPRRVHGSGTDFESLTPYVPGADVRTIDWKASARRGILISRQMQVEKGQQLAVLVDAGRLMLEHLGHLSRFDHALNATVMLSYVAQQRGDTLAVATFSNRIESFMPPTRGQQIMPRILDSLYRVEPRPLESDYWQAVAEVLGRLRRRSLVIMLTEVLDAAGSAGLMTNLLHASTRHLVLCVVLTDARIAQVADTVPRDLHESYAKAAASQVMLQRHLALEHMRSKGMLVLESPPEHVSVQLVRRYLEIRQGDLQ
jgi:uncharacterized protein (DUF58 family)